MGNDRTDRAGTQLGLGMTYGKAPDGSYFVSVTFQTGMCSFTFGVPIDQADMFIEQFAKNFKEVARVARREERGLIVPTPHNGNVH